MRKNLKTKIYVTVVTVLMLCAMTTVAYGAISWEGIISYNSYHYGYQYVTPEPLVKGDDSSAIVAYDGGPITADKMYVEILGSLDFKGTYTNYTMRHLYNGNYVKYYTVNMNEQAFIYNLVYETLKTSAFTKLKVYVYGTGNVVGRWSPTTR